MGDHGNIVAARFDHIATRPSKGGDDGSGPDPHLHTHVVIANMTIRPDGAWRRLDPLEIYRSQSLRLPCTARSLRMKCSVSVIPSR